MAKMNEMDTRRSMASAASMAWRKHHQSISASSASENNNEK